MARCYDRLLDLCKVGAEVVVFLVFFLVAGDVFLRLAGFQRSTYTPGAVEYCLLWFTMLGAPWLVRMKGHVFVDSLVRFLPRPAQAALAKFVYLACIGCSLLFVYFSFDLTAAAFLSGEMDIRGGAQPRWLLLAPMPVSFSMVAVEFLRYLVGVDAMYASRTDARENA